MVSRVRLWRRLSCRSCRAGWAGARSVEDSPGRPTARTPSSSSALPTRRTPSSPGERGFGSSSRRVGLEPRLCGWGHPAPVFAPPSPASSPPGDRRRLMAASSSADFIALKWKQPDAVQVEHPERTCWSRGRRSRTDPTAAVAHVGSTSPLSLDRPRRVGLELLSPLLDMMVRDEVSKLDEAGRLMPK
jgi:hypothetical protein